MELESAITKFFGDILRPIVTTAVETAIEKKIPSKPSDDLITVKEACLLLRCSQPTLYAHIHSGNIKLERIGRRSLLHKEQLLADLDAGKFRIRKDKHRK